MIIQSLQKIVGSQPSREHLLASLIDFGKKAFEVEKRNGMEIMEKLIEKTGQALKHNYPNDKTTLNFLLIL
jgi:hypothetical protein